ncbi:MAG: protoporphyrinogen/coproporphyrinogen oxidase [Thermoleophilaceae bacterium]
MRVAIVGGGPAGCAAAHRLRRLGHEPLIVEAEPRLGGRTWTLREDGFTIDTGAFYICSFYRRTLEVLDELGRRGDLRQIPRETGLYSRERGRWRWVFGSTGSLLRFPGLRPWERARVAGVFAAKSLRRMDPFDTEQLERLDTGATVAEWGRRALGSRAAEVFLRPSFEPWFLFRCEDAAAPLATAFVGETPSMKLLGFPEGTDSLCKWMAEGVEAKLGVRAERVEASDSGVRVVLEGGSADIEADAAVVATEATVAAGLLAGTGAAEPLARVKYAPVVHAILRFDEDRWASAPYSTHPAVPREHDAGTVGVVGHKLAGAVPPGRQALGVYFGSWAWDSLGDDADVVRRSRAEAGEMLGVDTPEPAAVRILRREHAIVQPQPGHYANVLAARAALPPRVKLAGDFFSISVIEGAVRSGDDAARELAASA